MIKPRTPPGVMELLPRDQIAFQRMLDTIRSVYERFGFLPVETPVFELSEVLLTKTGGETERQVYFAQSTGSLAKESSGGLPDLALRFDLTVPLARYVAQHEHSLAFPFRRYQMQRVYRGESAQEGRYREFYQCDIDVIGKDNLSVRYDAEMPAVIYQVFNELRIGPFTIQFNNRKLLRGFFSSLGIADGAKQALVLREIDKLDKRGADAVRATLTGPDFALSDAMVNQVMDFVQFRSNSLLQAQSKLVVLRESGEREGNADLLEGANELFEVLRMLHGYGVPEKFYALNFAIARGLDYYTGTVYETTLDEHPKIGSICSGGRYENLASSYTKSKLPGVGISIGLTRLFYQLRKAEVITAAESSVHVLVGLMDDERLDESLRIASELRAKGLNVEVQLEAKKLQKQFQYADKAGVRFVLLLGADEAARGVVKVKDLRSGDQFEISRDELAASLKVELEQQRAMEFTR